MYPPPPPTTPLLPPNVLSATCDNVTGIVVIQTVYVRFTFFISLVYKNGLSILEKFGNLEVKIL